MSEAGRPRRCFVALPVPDRVRRHLEAVGSELRGALGPDARGVRWTRPDAAHLTLRFFGDLGADDVSRAATALDRTCAGRDPIALSTGDLGAFPSEHRARVVWLGVRGDLGALTDLRDDLARRTAGLGLTPDARPFRPHITVGRVRGRATVRGMATAIARSTSPPEVAWTADRLALMASDPRPTGPVYTVLHTFSFAAR